MDWFRASVTNTANRFTKRMDIHTYIDLDILGGLTPIKYPPFPPIVNLKGITGVSTGEER
jgi:hypothetical protein